jgi:DNA-binding CsgD family transcriptional regulator
MSSSLSRVSLAESPPADGELQRLARELIRRAAASGITERVLVEIADDGIRCVVMRTGPAKTAAPILSPRETEIARMIAQGYPNKTIAAVLEISTWTVGTYLRRMFAKLGVTSRAAMVAKLMESASRNDVQSSTRR